MHRVELTPEDNVVCEIYDRLHTRIRIIVDFTDLKLDGASIVRINPEPDVVMEARIMLSPKRRPPSALGATRVTVEALREASHVIPFFQEDHPGLDVIELSRLFRAFAADLEESASYGSAA